MWSVVVYLDTQTQTHLHLTKRNLQLLPHRLCSIFKPVQSVTDWVTSKVVSSFSFSLLINFGGLLTEVGEGCCRGKQCHPPLLLHLLKVFSPDNMKSGGCQQTKFWDVVTVKDCVLRYFRLLWNNHHLFSYCTSHAQMLKCVCYCFWVKNK